MAMVEVPGGSVVGGTGGAIMAVAQHSFSRGPPRKSREAREKKTSQVSTGGENQISLFNMLVGYFGAKLVFFISSEVLHPLK